MANVKEDIRQFIISNFLFGQNGDALEDQQSFLETGVIDSTGVLELIGFLEQQYGIAVEDREIVPANLDSVDQLVAFVARKQEHRGETIAG
jgi:acyl carrier protein